MTPLDPILITLILIAGLHIPITVISQKFKTVDINWISDALHKAWEEIVPTWFNSNKTLKDEIAEAVSQAVGNSLQLDKLWKMIEEQQAYKNLLEHQRTACSKVFKELEDSLTISESYKKHILQSFKLQILINPLSAEASPTSNLQVAFDAHLTAYLAAKSIPPSLIDVTLNHFQLNNFTEQIIKIFNQDETLRINLQVERILAIYEKILGKNHPDIAENLNNTGIILFNLKQYKEALTYFEQALTIQEKKLGKTHPHTADTLTNAGYTYQILKDYAQAQPYLERALVVYQKNLGSTHPQTLEATSTLANLLRTTEQYQAAKPHYQHLLKIRQKTLGPNHPDTATILNNLGYIAHSTQDYDAAQAYYEQVLTIRETHLGPNHIQTATVLNNLAMLFSHQGDLNRTLLLLKRAHTIYQTVLGPDHPTTQTIGINLAFISEQAKEKSEGKSQKAE